MLPAGGVLVRRARSTGARNLDSNNRCPPPPPLLLDDDAVTTGLNWFLLGADWLLVVPGDGEGPGTWIDVFMAVIFVFGSV